MQSAVVVSMSADVDLDHVTIRFGDFTAVKNVTLKINGGEFFSILGPSGCGKTTCCARSPASSSRPRARCASAARTWRASAPTSARPR